MRSPKGVPLARCGPGAGRSNTLCLPSRRRRRACCDASYSRRLRSRSSAIASTYCPREASAPRQSRVNRSSVRSGGFMNSGIGPSRHHSTLPVHLFVLRKKEPQPSRVPFRQYLSAPHERTGSASGRIVLGPAAVPRPLLARSAEGSRSAHDAAADLALAVLLRENDHPGGPGRQCGRRTLQDRGDNVAPRAFLQVTPHEQDERGVKPRSCLSCAVSDS